MAVDIKRALKDKAYLDSLSKTELKELLDKTSGDSDLSEEELGQVAGGMRAEGGGSCETTTGSCLACKRSVVLGVC